MTNKIKAAIYCVVAVTLVVGLAASVNIHGNVINADTGYQLGAAAPLNHVLCGNGTVYVDSSNCLGSGTGRVCNSNGCYRIDSDGTIYQWGTATTTSVSCSGDSFSFPGSFTTTANLDITFGTINSSTSHGNLVIVRNSLSTSGFSASSHDGNDNCEVDSSFSWHAIGH